MDLIGFAGWVFGGLLASLGMEYAAYSRRRDAMAFGDLAQALALAAVTVDGFVIQY